MTSGKRVLVYAQHLSGVGHHVRIREIARALARAHRVVFAHGGRPVPRPDDGDVLQLVELSAIRRGGEGLEPLDASRRLAEVLSTRAAELERAARALAPDVVLIEHYPFSKWELEAEIETLIDAAHSANPAVEIVCSVRDILKRTRHERTSDEAYRRRVVERLNARFDALLVHADPSFTRLEEHFEGADDLTIPIAHTGFVSEKPTAARGDAGAPANEPEAGGPRVIVSTGGGAGSAALVERVIQAWARLAARGVNGDRRLQVFCGLFWSESEVEAVRTRAAAEGCALQPFTADFLRHVESADLSISRAGYNTCMNLLETRTRAILIPDPRMSDQRFRAQRLAEHGLAQLVADENPSVAELAEVIESALRSDRPRHAFDLDGAQRTCVLLSR